MSHLRPTEEDYPLGRHPEDYRCYWIGDFAQLLGVHINTLRNWERQGFLVPFRRPPDNRRIYWHWQLRAFYKNPDSLWSQASSAAHASTTV